MLPVGSSSIWHFSTNAEKVLTEIHTALPSMSFHLQTLKCTPTVYFTSITFALKIKVVKHQKSWVIWSFHEQMYIPPADGDGCLTDSDCDSGSTSNTILVGSASWHTLIPEPGIAVGWKLTASVIPVTTSNPGSLWSLKTNSLGVDLWQGSCV